MFNPQLDFGTKIKFEDKEYTVDQWSVQVLRPSRKEFFPSRPLMDLSKGDIFIGINGETAERLTHENGSTIFKATSDVYRDELGIPCIDIESVTDAELR